MKLFRAATTLIWISFRRLLWSGGTLMVMLPLLACTLGMLPWRGRLVDGSLDSFNEFSAIFVIGVFASLILPICAVAYATASVGGDREDRTLVFLLVRPVPRAVVLLAKYLATLPLVVGVVVASFFVYCEIAGPVGREAFRLYLPAVFLMSIAYVSLFHLFAVSFRHSTIIALIYALFMEFLLSNLPGIVKRVAVSYYGRSLMYAAGAPAGLEAPDPAWFEPYPAVASGYALLTIAVGGLAAALIVFQRREYADLT